MVTVVPLAGTWIEMFENLEHFDMEMVVPLAGTWIEIENALSIAVPTLSFPSRERGLK